MLGKTWSSPPLPESRNLIQTVLAVVPLCHVSPAWYFPFPAAFPTIKPLLQLVLSEHGSGMVLR